MTLYYIIANGSIAATGSTTIISHPDSNSPYYFNNGQYSQYWESDWVARLDSNDVGIPTEGQTWDFDINSWYFTKEALKKAVQQKRQNLENNSTISYMAFDIPVSINNLSMFLAQVSRLENPDDTTGVLYDRNKNSVSMTNADFIGLVDAVLNHFQSIIDAEVQLVTQIDAETLTTTAEINTAFATAMETPFQHINPITDLYNTIKGKVNKEPNMGLSENSYNMADKNKLAGVDKRENHTGSQPMESITGLDEAINSKQGAITSIPDITDAVTNLRDDYSPSDGYNNIINDGINASNAAYNDVATKLNTVLAILRTAGILIP